MTTTNIWLYEDTTNTSISSTSGWYNIQEIDIKDTNLPSDVKETFGAYVGLMLLPSDMKLHYDNEAYFLGELVRMVPRLRYIEYGRYLIVPQKVGHAVMTYMSTMSICQEPSLVEVLNNVVSEM